MVFLFCKAQTFAVFGTLLPFIGFKSTEILDFKKETHKGSFFMIGWLNYSLFILSNNFGNKIYDSRPK